eukprot:scaffold241058_cov36-Prasinocladus_malaysianus.AAC.1
MFGRACVSVLDVGPSSLTGEMLPGTAWHNAGYMAPDLSTDLFIELRSPMQSLLYGAPRLQWRQQGHYIHWRPFWLDRS